MNSGRARHSCFTTGIDSVTVKRHEHPMIWKSRRTSIYANRCKNLLYKTWTSNKTYRKRKFFSFVFYLKLGHVASLSNPTADTYGAGTAYPSGVQPRFLLWVRVARSLVFWVVFCRSLFVFLSFLFWPLCCLFFFDLRLLIVVDFRLIYSVRILKDVLKQKNQFLQLRHDARSAANCSKPLEIQLLEGRIQVQITP